MTEQKQIAPIPRIEPYIQPVNGIVQPPVLPLPNRPGRKTNVLEELKKVLNYIWRSRWSQHFKKPVDAIALGIPDYHNVVKHPMDLSTIKKRLDNNYYWQADEALEDFQLMFENCMLFNLEGTPVNMAGKELRSLFYTRLVSIDFDNEVELKPKEDKKKRKLQSTTYSYSKAYPSAMEVKSEIPPAPLGPNVNYDHIDGQIERKYCDHFLRTLRKEKYLLSTWPFNNGDLWREYGSNKKYDHNVEEVLDWPTIEHRLRIKEIKGMNDFETTLKKMYTNALRCFSTEITVRASVKRAREIFDGLLPRYKKQIADAKHEIRSVVTRRLKNLSDADDFCGELQKRTSTVFEENEIPLDVPSVHMPFTKTDIQGTSKPLNQADEIPVNPPSIISADKINKNADKFIVTETAPNNNNNNKNVAARKKTKKTSELRPLIYGGKDIKAVGPREISRLSASDTSSVHSSSEGAGILDDDVNVSGEDSDASM
ncbi:SWR1 complex bromodomain subunit bdf1-like [Scaptodrosophila lebanonensis]|uniref:SWR1 complex bromodomain subunit bdf1-like n=1 Tax=Drosophila lebanonensis TaxID=7225 RepID=A0A6J2TZC1_DROLE|nr:SWR1 complex bromodomain subunit bdf1-like [Scaptodrosophila lebanonensis]